MKLLIDVNHPAHVHLFRNLSKEIEKLGHKVLWTARTRDVLKTLLDHYNCNYQMLSKAQKGILGLGIELIERDIKLLKVVNVFKPDLMIGTSVCISHIGKLKNIPSAYFGEDNQDLIKLSKIAYPFMDVICTPDCFKTNLGKKHITYPSYQELAYLSPKRFTPDPNILKTLKINKGERFFVLRFVSFKASHDIRERGISHEIANELIGLLSDYGKVFINSEVKLPEHIEKLRIKIPPHKLLDVLNYATLCIGDSQTVIAEAAVLGTPSFRNNTYVGFPDKVPYLDELDEKYGLVYNYRPEETEVMFDKIKELLNKKNLKEIWQKKRKKMMEDKIDLTDWMLDFVLNFKKNFAK